MLKWKANEGERMLSRTKVPGPPNSVPATPGDIIACLKANPEACAEVTEALHGHWKASALAYRDERDAANARAERAEQALATVTAERDDLIARHGEIVEAAFLERDALKAKLAEAERQRDAEVNAHDKLDDLAVAYARERDEARATASNYLERWNAEVERLRETLDTVIAREGSLKAQLARVTDERNSLRSALTDSQEAVVASMRERLARYEAVVEALPKCVHRDGCDRRGTKTDGYSAFCDEHGGAWSPEPWAEALRALDSPVGAGTDSGGCEHKRQRCENDHAVCRDCGAVNRAVTGVEDWGPAAGPVGVAATADTGPGPLCAKCGAPIGYCRTVCARDVERSVTNGQAPEPSKNPGELDPPSPRHPRRARGAARAYADGARLRGRGVEAACRAARGDHSRREA